MSVERYRALLARQEREAQTLRHMSATRRTVTQQLLYRQHEAEWAQEIETRHSDQLGAALDALPPDLACALWRRIPADRRNEVLWTLTGERRALLAPGCEPGFAGDSVRAFELVEGRLVERTIRSLGDLDRLRPVWVDLLQAPVAERLGIGAHFAAHLPEPLDATELEVSARFHVEDNDDIHLHSNFLLLRDGAICSVPIAFVLHGGVLFSLRNDELPVFRALQKAVRTQPGDVGDGLDLLLDLYGADVETSADTLEGIYATLARVGRQVLGRDLSDEEAASILSSIAEQEDLNGRIRGNILDTQRALNFLIRSRRLSERQLGDTQQLLRNIESLNSHTAFLFDKINFLMDTTVGFININQNRRVNQLTAFGVVIMPINILAGIGGMSEFSMMTRDIPWPLAYGGFLGGAVLVGAATFAWLRRGERRSPRSRAPQRR